MTSVSSDSGREWVLCADTIQWMAHVNKPEPDDSPVPDLAKYECSEADDDYRHRMIENAIALAFTTLLILAGLWLANIMAHA